MKTIQIDKDLEDLIPGFLENRKKDLTVLKSWAAQSQFAEVAKIAHRLKGTSGGYGFAEMSEIGFELETASKAENLSLVHQALERLGTHLNEIQVEYIT